MTTGNNTTSVPINVYTNWGFGGWGEPTELDSRIWTGADGFLTQNSYNCKFKRWYQGWAYGKYWSTFWQDFSPPDTYYYAMYCFSFPDPPGSVTGVADLTAADRLISSIVNTEFAANIFLGEAPESIIYLYRKVAPLVRSIKYLKKGDVIRAFRAVGIRRIKGQSLTKARLINGKFAPSSWWLEYRYAITPMIMDCNDILEHLDRDLGPPRAVKIRKGGRQDVLPSVYFNDSPYMGNLSYWPDLNCTEFCTIGVTLREDFDYLKVDWMNPYTVFWELLPGSFIIDWALQVGAFLRARYFFNFAKFDDGFRSRLLKYHSGNPTLYPGTTTYPRIGWRNDSTFDSSYEERIYCTRTSWNGDIPLPRIINPLSKTSHWKRVADSFAILSTLSDKKLRRL